MLEIINKKYENIFKIGIILIIICIILSVISVQEIYIFPSWIYFLIVVIGFIGLFLCIISGIIGWRSYYLGKELDERQKKIMGRSALYAMFLTIIGSIIAIPFINNIFKDISTKELATIPLVIVILSYTIIYYFLNKKGDVK